MNALKRLERWYRGNCDGEWEHSQGVKIETLDNPGWWIEINLVGTEVAGLAFTAVEQRRFKRNWLVAKVEQDKFIASCGPHGLEDALKLFLDWAESKSARSQARSQSRRDTPA